MSVEFRNPSTTREDRRLLNEKDAAPRLGVSVRTLQAWRIRGNGPKFVKLNRKVLYRPEDLDGFVEAGLRTSTTDPGSSARATA